MKRKLCAVLAIFTLLCLNLCAFTFNPDSSVKNLTKPYVNTYECSFARFGNEDLLEKYEYLKVTILDDKQVEVSFKRINGKKRSIVCDYVYDDETNTFSAEVGIFGFKFRQATTIENGRFTISMPILGKPLIMIFES